MVVLAHGFGCGQNMGPLTQPALEARKQDERVHCLPEVSCPSHVSLDHADFLLGGMDQEPVRGQPRAALGHGSAW